MKVTIFFCFFHFFSILFYPVQELPSQYLALCAFALATSVSKVEPVFPVAVILTNIAVSYVVVVLFTTDVAVVLVVLKVVVVFLVVENVVVVLNVVVVDLVVLCVTDVFLEVK